MNIWTEEAPTQEGLYWLYGDEQFGTMGGNFTGSIPPRIKLHLVDIRRISNGLVGVAGGRFIELVPFDKEKSRAGFIGAWSKVELPPLPNISHLIPVFTE